jgi:hypothetical protein
VKHRKGVLLSAGGKIFDRNDAIKSVALFPVAVKTRDLGEPGRAGPRTLVKVSVSLTIQMGDCRLRS